MPQLPAFNENDLIASICRESFYEFVKEFWGEVIPEKPHWNWHIEYLCDELQIMAERVFKGIHSPYDLIVNISPGSTKSTIASVMFPPWAWTRMPSARCICGSYAYQLAMDLSRKSRDIVQCEKYRAVFPEIKLREDQNTKGYFANRAGGMRYAVGTGGSVTGMHAHFNIVDDPLDPAMAVSEAELKTCNDWMNETLPSRKVDKLVTPTILIMQRLHQNDPSGNRLAKASAVPVKHICVDAILSDNVKPEELKDLYIDGLMDPVRLPHKVLNESRAILGDYGFAGQYRQTPIPPGGGMFKVSRIAIDEPPRKFKMVARFWDKAGTHDGGAFTVGLKMAVDTNDTYWVLDVIRGQWASDEREERIKQTAKADGRKVIVGIEQEPGSGGKDSALMTTKNLAGYRVRVERPTGDKAWRADPYSAQVNMSNVRMREAPWNSLYLEELEYFPDSTYKDQVDASSGAFNLIFKGKRRAGGL